MDMMLADDRRAVRRSVVVECQVVRTPGGEVLGELGLDLSTDGMLVLSGAPCDVGESMYVTFRVPGTDWWIMAPARVTRVVEGRRLNDPGKAMALVFEGLDAETQQGLRVALDGLPETRSTRSPRIDYAATAGLISLDE